MSQCSDARKRVVELIRATVSKMQPSGAGASQCRFLRCCSEITDSQAWHGEGFRHGEYCFQLVVAYMDSQMWHSFAMYILAIILLVRVGVTACVDSLPTCFNALQDHRIASCFGPSVLPLVVLKYGSHPSIRP